MLIISLVYNQNDTIFGIKLIISFVDNLKKIKERNKKKWRRYCIFFIHKRLWRLKQMAHLWNTASRLQGHCFATNLLIHFILVSNKSPRSLLYMTWNARAKVKKHSFEKQNKIGRFYWTTLFILDKISYVKIFENLKQIGENTGLNQ